MPIVDPHWPRAGVWLSREVEDPELIVVGVPTSVASLSRSRADLTPQEVRQRLDRFTTFHGEIGVDFSTVRALDVGNWPVSGLDAVAMIDEVSRLARALPDAGLHLYLGGDNAITRPLVAAMGDDLSRVGVITFDAHHDVRSLDNGPSNGTPMRGLIEEHGLDGQHVVQLGIHSFANSREYRAYCDDVGITSVTVDQIGAIGIKTAVDVALSQLSAGCDLIYVDVDIDVLDRVFAPACPGARPGGLTVRQLAEGVLRCASHPKVQGMDFVEVDASIDHDHQTLDVMAHLLLSAVAGFATR
jgi:formiminoglutamase